MAYNQRKLDEYRARLFEAKQTGAHFPFSSFPNCPYCNGAKDANIKYIDPSTKPSTPFGFYQHVLLNKYRAFQRKVNRSGTPQINLDPDGGAIIESDEKEKDNAVDGKLLVVGPMVDQSELPFRLLCRYHGANLTYTPMLHAKLFVEGAKYRHDMLQTTNVTNEFGSQLKYVRNFPQDENIKVAVNQEKQCGASYQITRANIVDRPVIVQFCANDPEFLEEAAHCAVRGEGYLQRKKKTQEEAKATENSNSATKKSDAEKSFLEFIEMNCSSAPTTERYYHCDAVDLNLGCPQGIAKRGHYGSFLMEDWELIHILIHTLHVELEVPVTAKIRVFDKESSEGAGSFSVEDDQKKGTSLPPNTEGSDSNIVADLNRENDIFYDEELSVAFAKMIKCAGAQLIAVHGRIRSQKGQQSGLAEMRLIGKIALELNREYLNSSMSAGVEENGNAFHTLDDSLFFPVLSNGNVLHVADVAKHLQYYDLLTQECLGSGCRYENIRSVVQGHMCAEPLQWDPKLFGRTIGENDHYDENKGENTHHDGVPSGRLSIGATKAQRLSAIETAKEYLYFCKRCSMVRDRDTSREERFICDFTNSHHLFPSWDSDVNTPSEEEQEDFIDPNVNYAITDMGMIKAHLFKMLFHSYELHSTFRDYMANFDHISHNEFKKLLCLRNKVEEEQDNTENKHVSINKQEETLRFYKFQIKLMESHLDELQKEEIACEFDGAQPKWNKEEKKKKKEDLGSVNFFDDNADGGEENVGLLFF